MALFIPYPHIPDEENETQGTSLSPLAMTAHP